MAKRSPRLLFTEEELETPELQKPIKKAEKAQKKLTKAESKIPKKKIVQKQRVYDPKGNQVVTRLVFEETEKKRPSKLTHAAAATPLNAVSATSHRELHEDADGSVSASVSHEVISSAEGGIRTLDTAHRTLQDKPYARALKAERAADRANLKALYKEAELQNPEWGASPVSRFQQKRAIKKAYAEAKAGKAADNTVKASEAAAKAVKKTGEETSKAVQFVARHKKGFVILGVIGMMFLFVSAVMSSCSVMMSSLTSSGVLTTYPSADADMLAAEAQYLALEAELQEYLDNYESTHDYDEYHFVSSLEAKQNQGRGHYYDLSIQNQITKQQARALLYYQQHGFTSADDFEAFAESVEAVKQRRDALSAQITSTEKRLNEIAVLQKHITNYLKTKDIYAGYRASGYSKAYYEEHEDAIKLCKASKRAFDELLPSDTSGKTAGSHKKQLPSLKALRAEYAELLAMKKAAYPEYYRSKDEYRELLTYQANLAGLFGIENVRSAPQREHQQEEK